MIVFEPFYENYGPDSIISGAKPRFVSLRPPQTAGGEWTFDEQELREAFQPHTKAIVLNTPNNPTGKVFTRKEMELIRDLCVEFNVLAITDEIYEHILYDDAQHISIAALDGMRERTITINGLVEELQRHGMARRLGGGAAEHHECDPQGARFPDGGRACSFAGGRSGRAEPASRAYYTELAEKYRYAARSSDSGAGEGWIPLLPSAGRVLRDDGHQRLRLPE